MQARTDAGARAAQRVLLRNIVAVIVVSGLALAWSVTTLRDAREAADYAVASAAQAQALRLSEVFAGVDGTLEQYRRLTRLDVDGDGFGEIDIAEAYLRARADADPLVRDFIILDPGGRYRAWSRRSPVPDEVFANVAELQGTQPVASYLWPQVTGLSFQPVATMVFGRPLFNEFQQVTAFVIAILDERILEDDLKVAVDRVGLNLWLADRTGTILVSTLGDQERESMPISPMSASDTGRAVSPDGNTGVPGGGADVTAGYTLDAPPTPEDWAQQTGISWRAAQSESIANEPVAAYPIIVGADLSGEAVYGPISVRLWGAFTICIVFCAWTLARLPQRVANRVEDVEQAVFQRLRADRLQAECDTVGDGLVVIDKSGSHTRFNARFLEMFTKSLRQAPTDGQNGYDILQDLVRAAANPDRARAILLGDGAPPEGETLDLPWGDGRSLEVWWRLPDTHQAGHPVRIWYFRDVTGRRRIETALRRSERRYRAIFDTVGDGLMVFDEGGHIVDLNRAAVRVTGSGLGARAMQRSTLDHDSNVGPVKPTELKEFLIESLKEQKAEAELLWRRRGDGELVELIDEDEELPADPVFSAALKGVRFDYGGRASVLALVRDVTEERRRQADLQRAKEQAEAADREKSRFLAMMSHEIRTPMTGILGMADLLLGTPLNREQAHHLDSLKRSATALLGLLNDLLDFSKIEAGQMSLESVVFDPKAIVQDVLELYWPSGNDKGVSIESKGLERLPSWLRGDPMRLRQILANLVGNGVKFTEQGTVLVEIEHCEPLTGGETEAGGPTMVLRIAVKDTGIGISPQAQAGLFSPFTQADASTSRRYGGSGLGLAICNRLVGLMGGRITVESQEGVGTAFRFSLMIGAAHVADPPDLATSPDQQDPAVVPRPVSILLAEDNETNRSLIIAMLERGGHRVTGAVDGRDAWQILLSRHNTEGSEPSEDTVSAAFDVAIIDMRMPVMDGPALVREIRRGPLALKDLPLIGLTADAMADDLERYKAQGLDDILTKPIDWVALDRSLARLCGSIAQSDGTGTPSPPPPGGSVGHGVIPLPERGTAVSEEPLRVFDPAMLDALAERLPPNRVADMISKASQSVVRGTDTTVMLADQNAVGAMREAAHALKGLAAQFGLLELAKIAETIQRAAEKDNTETWQAACRILPDSSDAAVTALKHWGAEVGQIGPPVQDVASRQTDRPG